MLSSRCFSAPDAKHTLSLEAVKVFREPATVREKIVTLDYEHKGRVYLIEGVEQRKKVAGSTMGCERKEIADGRWDERAELLLGEEFYIC